MEYHQCMSGFLTRRHAGIGLFLGSGWGLQTSLLCNALPRLQFSVQPLTLLLKLVVGCTKLCYGLLREQLFQRPLFNVLLLVLFELGDETNSPLQNRSFVLLAARDNLGQLVNAFVDSLAASALHCIRVNALYLFRRSRRCISYLLCGYPSASCATLLNQHSAWGWGEAVALRICVVVEEDEIEHRSGEEEAGSG